VITQAIPTDPFSNPQTFTANSLVDIAQSADFRAKCNSLPFLFRHSLGKLQEFQADYIRRLAVKFAEEDRPMYCGAGKTAVDGSFDGDGSEENYTPRTALDNLTTAQLLLKLPKISALPEYQKFLGGYLDQILEMSGLSAHGYSDRRSISVFMATPGKVTPYHIDGELNYLCQITGTKKVWVVDGRDRELVTEEELEKFWRGDGQAAYYKELCLERAYCFTLQPGTGVHIPINYPHWVENGSELSISVSLNFHPAYYRKGAVHRFNSYLREWGLNPTPPGKNALLDEMKGSFYRLARQMSRLAKASAH
jgi:hypothetical protein